jgi:hypothetical protein
MLAASGLVSPAAEVVNCASKQSKTKYGNLSVRSGTEFKLKTE